MISTCIHGRTATGDQPAECLDCEELTALRALEDDVRDAVFEHAPLGHALACTRLQVLDDIRRRMGIGAIGHPETRGLERVPASVNRHLTDGEVVTTRERAREIFGHGSLMGECPLPFTVLKP